MTSELEMLLNKGFSIVGCQKKETAILMIHGFASSPKEFEPLSEYLKIEYDIYAPILPGHKTSIADFCKKKHTDWITAAENIYNHLQKSYSKIILLGVSMGGTICLNIASRKNPYKIITVSSPIDFLDFNFAKGILSELRNTKITVATIVKGINALSVKEKQDKEKKKEASIDKIKIVLNNIYKKLKKDIIKVDNDMSSYIDTYEDISYNAVKEIFLLVNNTKPKLSKIKCDILVIHSRGDKLIPVSNSSAIIAGVTSDDREQFVVTNSAHNVLIDAEHERVFKRIKEFIQRTN